MRYFEDFVPGSTEDYGSTLIDEPAMLAFAAEFDPQPMHLDASSAQAARIGGLLASGWFTCARNMRLMADNILLRSAGMGSPGVARLRWSAPVRAGDLLSGRMDVLGRRASASKPDRGFVDFRFEMRNQHGTIVLSQENLIMFARREPGSPLADAAPAAAPAAAPQMPPRPETFISVPTENADPAAHIEDIPLGRVICYGSHRFDADDIIRFARDFDPQPFHLSEEGGRASHFGGLAASGWHTASVWMATVIRYWQEKEKAAAETRSKAPFPNRGPGFGFDDLRWIKPVMAGDTLTFFARVIEARPSVSKPGWGILTQRNHAINQRGEVVFAFTGSVLWGARG